jgi:hypothetical protein
LGWPSSSSMAASGGITCDSEGSSTSMRAGGNVYRTFTRRLHSIPIQIAAGAWHTPPDTLREGRIQHKKQARRLPRKYQLLRPLPGRIGKRGART